MKIFWYDRHETVFLHPIQKSPFLRIFEWKHGDRFAFPMVRDSSARDRGLKYSSKVLVDLEALPIAIGIVEHLID